MNELSHRTFPCNECPWRRDVDPGRFPRERFEALRATCRDPLTVQAGLAAPMFGCHKGEPGTGRDLACAGWLAREGVNHLGIRLALITGQLPHSAVAAGDDWPELYDTYEDLEAAQHSAAGAGGCERDGHGREVSSVPHVNQKQECQL